MVNYYNSCYDVLYWKIIFYNKMRDSKEISDILVGLQRKANENNIPLDTIEAWRYLWDTHRSKNGSLKYITSNEYFRMMRARENYCISYINHAIDWYCSDDRDYMAEVEKGGC